MKIHPPHFSLHRGLFAAFAVIAAVGVTTHLTIRASALEARPTETVVAQATPGENTQSNPCLDRCEQHRRDCNASAAGDSEAAGHCETTVTSPCVDACRNGRPFTPPPYPTPAATQPACAEDRWECGAWTDCSADGSQSRECILVADCETAVSPIPANTQSCAPTATEPVEPKETPSPTPAPTPEPEPVAPPAEEPTPTTETEPTTATNENETIEEAPAEEPLAEEEPDAATLRATVTEQAAAMASTSETDELIGTRMQDGTLIDASAAAACRAGGISEIDCRDLLVRALELESCAERGLMTKSSCARHLTQANGGTFPDCESATAAQCDAIKHVLLLAYLDEDTKAKADMMVTEMTAADTVAPVPGMTSVRDTMAEQADWWASSRPDGAETSAGVVIIDSDRDGLPDEFELAHGYNPNSADTDGDGIEDREQLERDATRTWDPTAKALFSRAPLEQPRGSGTTDDSMTPDLSEGDGAMHGTCEPNATCLLFVYTYVPTVFAVSSDANGQWTYDIGESVGDGTHVAYVVVTDDVGRITAKSNPLSFFVQEAQAADDPNAFLGPLPLTEASKPQPFIRWYVTGALVAIAAALALGYLILKPKHTIVRESDTDFQ